MELPKNRCLNSLVNYDSYSEEDVEEDVILELDESSNKLSLLKEVLKTWQRIKLIVTNIIFILNFNLLFYN